MGYKIYKALLMFICFLFSSATFIHPLLAAATAEEEIYARKKAMLERYNYAAAADNFNPEVEISGEKVALKPGEEVKIPEKMAAEGKNNTAVTWKDIARYESVLARRPEANTRWFIETIWRERINQVLNLLEKELKEKYPHDYQNINIAVEEVALALGMTEKTQDGKIPSPVGFYSGEKFIKIPNIFGGKITTIVSPPEVDISGEKREQEDIWRDASTSN